jgi:hypothetical protein
MHARNLGLGDFSGINTCQTFAIAVNMHIMLVA